MSYILPNSKADLGEWASLLEEIRRFRLSELMDRLLSHPTARVREGCFILFEHLYEGDRASIEVMVNHLTKEARRRVRRAGLRALLRMGRHLPDETARSLLGAQDWIVQSYALRSLKGLRSCLLFSDGTEFASELGRIAESAGYKLIHAPHSLSLVNDIKYVEINALRTHELIILVRGEHFIQYTTNPLYTKLRHYVSEGGSLFATSWTAWESKHLEEFAQVMPFVHLQSSYNEDVEISCKPAQSRLAQSLFPVEFDLRTSFELLGNKPNSIVLLRSSREVPIFGYRQFGSGVCFYLNTCQHSCIGPMRSPLQSSPEFSTCIENVFKKLYEQKSFLPEQASDQRGE
jgi:hypothetical protein